MSIKINGKEIKKIKVQGKEVSLGKVNGRSVWSGQTDYSLEFRPPYTLKYTAKENGIYEIKYANNNGILTDYDAIAVKKGVAGVYSGFNMLNVAPKTATKIVLAKNNVIKAEIPLPSFLVDTHQEEMLYKVGLISDTHVDGDGDDTADSIRDLNNALNYFVQQNVDFVAHCGDFTEDGRTVDYTAITNILSNFPNVTLYSVAGNHDNYSNLEAVTGNPLYYEQIMPNGDVFLFCGSYQWSTTDPFSTEELNWFQSKLEEYSSRRVFFFLHYYIDPVGDANGLKNHGLGSTGQAATIRSLLAEHTNHVAYFSGHSHLSYRLQDLASTANVSAPTSALPIRVHIPSNGRPRVLEDGTLINEYIGSEFGFMEVYNDYIKIQGYDAAKGKKIPIASYIIPFEVI